MELPYAFEITGRASALPFALWCGDYTPGVLGTRDKPSQPCRIGFAPVVGAYVVCIDQHAAKASLCDASEALRFGRTNDFGWVLLREAGCLGAPDEVPVSGWRKKELPPGGLSKPSHGPAGAGADDANDALTDAMDAGVPPPRDLSMFGPDDAVMFELDMRHANPELMYVMPNSQYYLFWSYDVVLFERFVGAAQRDLERAIADYQVGLYTVQPFLPRAPVARLSALSSKERGAVARLMSKLDGEGYHGGWLVFEGMSCAIFDGTPAALRTLYLCEWLQWRCEHAVHDDPHWPYLLALGSAIRASKRGAPIHDLAERLPSGERGQRARQLRAYLHALAWAGMDDRTNVVSLVDIWGESPLHVPWRDVAHAMQRLYSLRHPAEDAPDLRDFKFSADERAALVAYFDMYVLGFRRATDEAALDAHWQNVEHSLGWLRDQQRALMATLDHVSLTRTLALHVRDGHAQAALADRYHYQCTCHEIPFWEPAAQSLPNQSAWDAYAPFVKWMAEDPGLVTEAFLGLLRRYLPAYRDLTRDSLEQLLGYLFRYHLTFHGKAIEQTLPTKQAIVRIEPDARSGRVVARLFRGDKQTVLAELELLSELTTIAAGEAHAPVGAVDNSARFNRYRRALAKGQVRTFAAREHTLRVLDPESPLLAGFPAVLTEAAGLLSAGLATTELLAQLAKQRTWEVHANLYLEALQEGLQALEPGVSLTARILERASSTSNAGNLRSFVKGAERLGRAGSALESVRNLVAGGGTLATFFAPERAQTDLASYLERGEGLPALLETTKGLVQVISGSAGVGATLLGPSTVAAAVPLGTWVALGLVTVVTLDVLIYVSTAGGSPTKEFEDKVRLARARQFRLDGDRIMLPEEQLPRREGTTNQQLARSLLAKQLGTLHAVVKAYRASASA